jgi:LPS sulfotransferase NodH
MIFHRDEITPFVLIFDGRCGSTYLTECLDSHPQIRANMEILCALKEKKKSSQEQLEWIHRFLAPEEGSPYKAIGFKTKLRDVLDVDRFSQVLQELSVHIIHLQRRNLIKSTVSYFNSVRLRDKTGDWNLYDEGHRPTALTLELHKFNTWLKRIESRVNEETKFVTGLKLPTITLYYEDFLMDSPGLFKRTFAFLGVSDFPVQGKALKTTSDDLRHAIANFDELRSHYLSTPYKSMFDEILITD